MVTPAAVELALEIRREIDARHDEADRLRLRAVERAQYAADLAQRRFMLVDPSNRGRKYSGVRMERQASHIGQRQRERSQQQDRLALDDAIRDRLIAMTADFKILSA